jgi:hypothetical protein
MKALFWSAVINGIVAVPLMAVIIVLASKRPVMVPYVAPKPIIVLGRIATAVMGVAAAWMFVPGQCWSGTSPRVAARLDPRQQRSVADLRECVTAERRAVPAAGRLPPWRRLISGRGPQFGVRARKSWRLPHVAPDGGWR